MTKRTTLNLDTELLDEAAVILATEGNTETIHAALRDVVRRARLRRLAKRDFSSLTPELLGELRQMDVTESNEVATV